MRRKRLLIILALLLAAGITVWRAPASIAASWLEKTGHPLQLQMTAGTLWKGTARNARWQGLLLGESSWRLRGITYSPLGLKYEINSESRQFQVSGLVYAQPGGTVHAEQLAGHMPASWVNLQSFLPGLQRKPR